MSEDRNGNGHLGDRASGHLDGQLEDHEHIEAEEHLAHCATCSAMRQRVAEVRQALRSLPPVEPPAGFYERLLAGTFPSVRVRRGLRLGVLNAVAAAAIWVLVLGVGNFTAARRVAPSVGTSVSFHQAAMTTAPTPQPDSVALSSRWQLPAEASQFRLASVMVEPRGVRAEYTNGASLVTVMRQRGRLDWSHLPSDVSKSRVDGQRVVVAGDQQWSVLFVERAPYVYTVVAPVGSGVVEQIAAALPGSKSRSLSDRLEGAANGLVDCFGFRG